MRIEETRAGDVTVLAIAGELDARTLPDAQARLSALLAELRVRLVFDLSGMEIVTSSAVGFLVDAAKRTRALGGDAVLCRPTALLTRTLDALKFGKFLRVYPSDDLAVAGFREIRAADAAGPPPRRGWWPFGRRGP